MTCQPVRLNVVLIARFTFLAGLLVVLTSGAPVRAAFPGGNGKVVFQSNRDGDTEIFVMSADGSSQRQLTDNSTRDEGPRFSPDGTKILFSSDRGGSMQIYVMDVDGEHVAQLTTAPGSSGSPAWSPDATRIAFSSDRDGPQAIYVMNADGSGTMRLTFNQSPTSNEPVWSPDGTKLLFYSDVDGDSELFVIAPDGSGLTQLTFNSQINDVQPDWSPDGTRIVFAQGPFGTHELEVWTMSAAGGDQRRITVNPAIDNVPSFSPDGRRILFSSDRTGDTEIYVVNSDGTGLARLTDVAGEDFLPDWQPVNEPPADQDQDGVPDASDNCPAIANAGQEDRDANGLGDACDAPPPPPATVQFSSGQYEGGEGSRSVRVNLVRGGDLTGTVKVELATTGGTASSGTTFDELSNGNRVRAPQPDYGGVSGVLAFAPGENVKTVFVPIVDDDEIEEDESVTLVLRNPVGAVLGAASSAILTIHDNDPNVSFALSGSTAEESNGAVTVDVELSSIPAGVVSVGYTVSGAAVRGLDHGLTAGTLTFGVRGAGVRQASIRIPLFDDRTIEPDETVVVELTNPVNAVLGARTTYTLTILASDAPAPDAVGNSRATARFVDLVTQPRQVIGDFIYSGDADVFALDLRAGDFLAIDVDGVAPEPLRGSTLRVTDPAGAVVVVDRSQEPDSAASTGNPAYGFRATVAGRYYLELTAATGPATYTIELHRVALAQGRQDPAALDVSGAMFAWLDGRVLSIAGPTGYGFSLVGAWTQTVARARNGLATARYSLAAGSPVTMRGALGDVPLGVLTHDVSINTTANRWGSVFGSVAGSSIAIDIGLPIGDVAQRIGSRFGLQFSAFDFQDAWHIELGSQITGATGFKQVLAGVPYFMYNEAANFHIEFGRLSTRVPIASKSLFAINPADPSIAARFSASNTVRRPALALSAGGLIPSRMTFSPSTGSGGAAIIGSMFGHAYAQWDLQAPGNLPVFWLGEATVNLDANGDGQWLGGSGTASDLFRGDLDALGDMARDVSIGFDGAAIYRLKKPIAMNVQLGIGSAFYDGPLQAAWFKGMKGTGGSPWHGTLFSALEFGQDDFMEGVIHGDGRFLITSSSTLTLPANSSLLFRLTLRDSGIRAEVTGRVGWDVAVTIDGAGASCEARADASGSLDIGEADGRLDFAGSLGLEGHVRCYVGGTKVASSGFNISGEVTEDRIVYHLPIVGKVTLKLP